VPDYYWPAAGVSLLARGHSRPVHTSEKNEVSIPQPSNKQAKLNNRQSLSSSLPRHQPECMSQHNEENKQH